MHAKTQPSQYNEVPKLTIHLGFWLFLTLRKAFCEYSGEISSPLIMYKCFRMSSPKCCVLCSFAPLFPFSLVLLFLVPLSPCSLFHCSVLPLFPCSFLPCYLVLKHGILQILFPCSLIPPVPSSVVLFCPFSFVPLFFFSLVTLLTWHTADTIPMFPYSPCSLFRCSPLPLFPCFPVLLFPYSPVPFSPLFPVLLFPCCPSSPVS